jgi:hypothetical protein
MVDYERFLAFGIDSRMPRGRSPRQKRNIGFVNGCPGHRRRRSCIQWMTSLCKSVAKVCARMLSVENITSMQVMRMVQSEHIVSVEYTKSNDYVQVEGTDQTHALSQAVITIAVAR